MISVAYHPRLTPLKPLGAVASGSVAVALCERLRRDCSDLRGVFGDELLVILGPEPSLPWVPGLTYIAPHPGAARLWTDVHVEPSVPASWLVPHLPTGPALIWDNRLIALAGARLIEPDQLPQWR